MSLYYHAASTDCDPTMKQTHIYDVLIIGSGAAGLAVALQLDPNLRVHRVGMNEDAFWPDNAPPFAEVLSTIAVSSGYVWSQWRQVPDLRVCAALQPLKLHCATHVIWDEKNQAKHSHILANN